MSVRVHVNPSRHRAADVFDRRGITNAGGMVVDQVSLELFHLFIGQDNLGELPDPRVDAIHDLMRRDFLLEHETANLDAFQRRRCKFDRLIVPRDLNQLVDCQSRSIQRDAHRPLPRVLVPMLCRSATC